MEIRISTHFEQRYKKLPQTIKEEAKKQEKLFVTDLFDPRISHTNCTEKMKENGRIQLITTTALNLFFLMIIMFSILI